MEEQAAMLRADLAEERRLRKEYEHGMMKLLDENRYLKMKLEVQTFVRFGH